MDELFYVQKTGSYVGNSMLWRRKCNNGYTPNLKDARIFTKAEAAEICGGFNSDKKMWPKKYIDKRIQHHIDKRNCNYKRT